MTSDNRDKMLRNWGVSYDDSQQWRCHNVCLLPKSKCRGVSRFMTHRPMFVYRGQPSSLEYGNSLRCKILQYTAFNHEHYCCSCTIYAVFVAPSISLVPCSEFSVVIKCLTEYIIHILEFKCKSQVLRLQLVFPIMSLDLLLHLSCFLHSHLFR